LLGNTSDLMIGFGMSKESALKLSSTVQGLSADLASFNNLEGGATRASEILTKALLGERDALISLGIKISEADVKQELLKRGTKDLTGELLMQERAEITLELALRQTEAAQGDVARSAGTYATEVRTLKKNLKELGEEIGNNLKPAMTSWLADLNLIIEYSKELRTDKQVKELKKLEEEYRKLQYAAMTPIGMQFNGFTVTEGMLKKIQEDLKEVEEKKIKLEIKLGINEKENARVKAAEETAKATEAANKAKEKELKKQEKILAKVKELNDVYDKIDKKGVLFHPIEDARKMGEEFRKYLENIKIAPGMVKGQKPDTKPAKQDFTKFKDVFAGMGGRKYAGAGAKTREVQGNASGSPVGDWTTTGYKDAKVENMKYAEGKAATKVREAREAETGETSTLMGDLGEGLARAIPVLGAFTGGLAKGIIAVITSSETWKGAMEKMSGPIMEIVDLIGLTLKPVLDLVVDVFRGLADVTRWLYNEVIVGVGNGIIEIINGIIWLVNLIPGIDIKKVDYMQRTYDMIDKETDAREKNINSMNRMSASFDNLSRNVQLDVIRSRVAGGLDQRMAADVNINLMTDTGTKTITATVDSKTGVNVSDSGKMAEFIRKYGRDGKIHI